MEKLTIQEEEVMIYIWELQDCFVKDIVSKYPQPAPPYTTVASIVKKISRERIRKIETYRKYLSIYPQFVKMNTKTPLHEWSSPQLFREFL